MIKLIMVTLPLPIIRSPFHTSALAFSSSVISSPLSSSLSSSPSSVSLSAFFFCGAAACKKVRGERWEDRKRYEHTGFDAAGLITTVSRFCSSRFRCSFGLFFLGFFLLFCCQQILLCEYLYLVKKGNICRMAIKRSQKRK